MSIVDKPKISFQNTIYYKKLNSLWNGHRLDMHYFHGLKTMTFSYHVAAISYF